MSDRKKIIAEAENTQKNWHDIFMQTPIPMAIMKGPNHIFSLANSSYLKLVGKEVFNKSFLDVFNNYNSEKIIPILDIVFHRGESITSKETSFNVKNLKGHFSELIVNIEYHPFRDDLGETIGVMVIIHNITDQVLARRKVEDSEARYKSLADTIPQLMWTASKCGTINYSNERSLRYSGISSNQNYGKSWKQSIHPDDRNRVVDSWMNSITTGDIFIQEYRILNTNGNYRWFLGQALPVKNEYGEILYWNGTATDIDDYKEMKKELLISKEVAENANATKSAFLANMSHEIRTPLSAIIGFTELLKNSEILSNNQVQYLDIIHRNGNALTGIIDDILDLAKVEAGKLEVEKIEFSLIDLLNEVIELLMQKANCKGISLSIKIFSEIPNKIWSDPKRLRQIFINIIGNAVKFTSIGSVDVVVKAEHIENKKLKIFVEVIDTGSGITDKQRIRLFEPFMQADITTSRQFGGTGLGLVLSKRLSETLGGTISLESYEKNKGSTFVISFEAGIKNISTETIETKIEVFDPIKSLPLEGMKILYADDSLDNQFLIEHFLTKAGAKVSLACDGEEAVKGALETEYDVILMDIQMPKMDGYRAAKILMDLNVKAPILALTAHAMTEEKEKTRLIGFDGHLTKPFNFNELLHEIVIRVSAEHKVLNTKQFN